MSQSDTKITGLLNKEFKTDSGNSTSHKLEKAKKAVIVGWALLELIDTATDVAPTIKEVARWVGYLVSDVFFQSEDIQSFINHQLLELLRHSHVQFLIKY